jgi:hypothetical protein
MRIFERRVEAIEKLAAIGQSGQWVVQRLVAQLLFKLMAVRHIAEYGQGV